MTWEDVGIDVFLRFAQFVHTGAYASFAPAEREPSSGHTEGVGGTTIDVDEKRPEITASPEPLEEKRKGRLQLPYSLASFNVTACNRAFGSSDRPYDNKRDLILVGQNPPGLFGKNHIWQTKPAPQTSSYEQLFIGHVKIWVVAEKYAIVSLQDLASSHLVRELAHGLLYPCLP
jgi:hypothetical protein